MAEKLRRFRDRNLFSQSELSEIPLEESLHSGKHFIQSQLSLLHRSLYPIIANQRKFSESPAMDRSSVSSDEDRRHPREPPCSCESNQVVGTSAPQHTASLSSLDSNVADELLIRNDPLYGTDDSQQNLSTSLVESDPNCCTHTKDEEEQFVEPPDKSFVNK